MTIGLMKSRPTTEAEGIYRILGNVNLQRYLLALQPIDDGNGNIVCRAQVDPNFALPLAGNAFAASQLAGDIAACQPLNPFGEGNVSQGARDYILQDSSRKARSSNLCSMPICRVTRASS